MMYKVLIVDDEPAIREGLTTLIDWEACGFQVADTAGNGREALEKLEKLEPRLVIMDIRMPGMSGLEVTRRIRDHYSADSSHHHMSPRVLLLTGYADFEYARQAIAYGVDGYLLKPVDEEEMTSELRRIHRLITSEQQQQHTWHHKGQEQQGATLERIMESLLLGTWEVMQEHLQEPNQAIHIPSGLRDWSAYQVLLLGWTSATPDSHLPLTTLKQRLDEAFASEGDAVSFILAGGLGLLLQQPLTGRHQAAWMLEKLERVFKPLALSPYAAAGPVVTEMQNIHKSYLHALSLLEVRFALGGRRVLLSSDAPESDSERQGDTTISMEQLQPYGERLYYAVDVANKEVVKGILNELREELISYSLSEQVLKDAFAQLFTLVLNKLFTGRHERLFRDYSGVITDVYARTTLQSLLEHAYEQLSEIADALHDDTREGAMKRMTDFIQAHYHENLKLEMLAETFSYNSGYLGKLFKSHTGESFNVYLDKVRIEQAKRLLLEGKKVHQVAVEIGYANADYFHAKFKKYVGCSPSSYRASAMK